MGYKSKGLIPAIIVLSVLFLNIHIVMAVAFPFRAFNEGEPVPDVQLNAFDKGGQPLSFSGMKGKPFVAVFWGADLPEKFDRSVQILEEVGSLSAFHLTATVTGRISRDL